jgi:uncharacterized membrane protein YphA (DoxX/SURF4 family)/thiol-disulfide isomerase/thioredoxin
MLVWHSREGWLLVDGLERAAWKSRLSWVGAAPLAILFLVSGVWKVTGPLGWAVRIGELRVPHAVSLEAALAAGIAETVGAVWILVPRFRRWGAILIGLLLAAFIAWFAANYGALRGVDCSCFPWVRRVVGPGFFAGDAAMLALAVLAGMGAPRPSGARPAIAVLATVTVFALVSYGVEAERSAGAAAPAAVTVNGKPFPIGHGKYFLFFFNPGCSHCAEAARRMARLDWRDATVIAVPIEQPQFAGQFLDETGLRAVVSTDFQKLRQEVGYTSYPYGVAVEDGRQKARLTGFDAPEPEAALRRLGLVR